MRTWTLISQPRHIFAHQGPEFSEAHLKVIELDPVLDLLDDLIPTDASDDQVNRGIKARAIRDSFLKSHGRLSSERKQDA